MVLSHGRPVELDLDSAEPLRCPLLKFPRSLLQSAITNPSSSLTNKKYTQRVAAHFEKNKGEANEKGKQGSHMVRRGGGGGNGWQFAVSTVIALEQGSRVPQ